MGKKRWVEGRAAAERTGGRLSSNQGSSTAGRRDRRKDRGKEGRIIRTDI